ncbi:hypothetical protein B0T16DRAFT_408300 [Cercophora newfieldiana]|uniref:Uncharacterized protein n=1 Tax=Cercophora newfieldiana TaxID=92897 RepID=A0AA39Y9G8_9PEZI|nr:hypothetical protein B0T16DRAFT_408300 [Cercophora newfieldiana]
MTRMPSLSKKPSKPCTTNARNSSKPFIMQTPTFRAFSAIWRAEFYRAALPQDLSRKQSSFFSTATTCLEKKYFGIFAPRYSGAPAKPFVDSFPITPPQVRNPNELPISLWATWVGGLAQVITFRCAFSPRLPMIPRLLPLRPAKDKPPGSLPATTRLARLFSLTEPVRRTADQTPKEAGHSCTARRTSPTESACQSSPPDSRTGAHLAAVKGGSPE